MFAQDHRAMMVDVRANIPGVYIFCDGHIVGKFTRDIPGRAMVLSWFNSSSTVERDIFATSSFFEEERKIFDIRTLIQTVCGIDKIFRVITVTPQEWEILFDRDDVLPEE